MMTKISYSQTLLITETQRDSIYSKIIRGNEAIENNKVLGIQIKKRDSVISLQKEINSVNINTISLQESIISNLNKVIINKDSEISNEIIRGKRNKRKSFVKGVIIGTGATLLSLILIN